MPRGLKLSGTEKPENVKFENGVYHDTTRRWSIYAGRAGRPP